MSQFEDSAVQLSQSPLGIIALFIVLIHGFAGLILGFGKNIGSNDRSILVGFLVIFPVFVLLMFGWLVSSHSVHLLPGAFRTDEAFLKTRSIPYGKAGIDNQFSQTQAREKPVLTLQFPSATGSLYWLGHDLMWTADLLLRKGPSGDVLVGLSQARHHLAQIGLAGSSIDGELNFLEKLIQQEKLISPEGELSPSLRDTFASRLGSIIDQLGSITETAQGNFKVPPHWKRTRS